VLSVALDSASMDSRIVGCLDVKILFMMDQMVANLGELMSHLIMPFNHLSVLFLLC